MDKFKKLTKKFTKKQKENKETEQIIPDTSHLPNAEAIATLAVHILIQDKHLQNDGFREKAIENIRTCTLDERKINKASLSEEDKLTIANLIVKEYKEKIPANPYSQKANIVSGIITHLGNIKEEIAPTLNKIIKTSKLRDDGLRIMELARSKSHQEQPNNNLLRYLPDGLPQKIASFVNRTAGAELYSLQKTIYGIIKKQSPSLTPEELELHETTYKAHKGRIKQLTFPSSTEKGTTEKKGIGGV